MFGMSPDEISRRFHISRRCILQTIRKHHEFHRVDRKPGAGRPPKVTDRQKRLIKLQQLRDDRLSLNELVRYAYTQFNLTVHRQTVSRILRDYDMVSSIAPNKPQITPTQRRVRFHCSYEHLSCSEKDWSNVIFSDESNYETLNRKNRIYIRRFGNDILETNLPTAFEKFPSHQVQQVLCQQDNAGPHVSAMTQEYFKRKGLKQLCWLSK